MNSSVALGSEADVVRGVSFAGSDAHIAPSVGTVPILRAGNIRATLDLVHGLIWVDGAFVSPEQRLRTGDVAICMSSGSASVVGKSAVLLEPFDGSVGAFCAIVRPRERLDALFLGYYLRSPAFWSWRDKAARGVGIQNLKVSELGQLPIPLPPLDEQRRIAARLRARIAEVDHLREGADERARSLTALGASAIRATIGTNANAADPVELGSIANLQLGKMMSPAARRGERALPYLRNANVQWDRFDLADVGQMDFTVVEETKFALRPGDVLVCEGGDPGRAAVWAGEIVRCTYQKALHRIRALPARLDPQYLVYRLWLGALDGEFTNSQAATTIAHLPAVRPKELKLALPPLADQRRTAARLREQLAEIDRAKAALAAQREAIDALPAALLREVFGPPGRVAGSIKP